MAVEGEVAATIKIEVEIAVTKESLKAWDRDVDSPEGRDVLVEEMRDEIEEMWTEWGPTTKLEVTIVPQSDGS